MTCLDMLMRLVERGGVKVSVKSSFKQFPARLDYNSCLCIDVICLSVSLSVCPSVFHLSFHPYVCQSLNICLHIKNIHVYINKTSQMRLCLVTC